MGEGETQGETARWLEAGSTRIEVPRAGSQPTLGAGTAVT